MIELRYITVPLSITLQTAHLQGQPYDEAFNLHTNVQAVSKSKASDQTQTRTT